MNKEEFWESLIAIPPAERSCWNCKHSTIVNNGLTGNDSMCGKLGSRFMQCTYSLWHIDLGDNVNGWEYSDE